VKADTISLDIAVRRAELTPERPAVYWRDRWLSYREMNARAGRLAARLAERGVRKGDRVSILAQNHLAHLDLILATAKLGFIYTPFNHRLGPPEQQALAAYVRPSLLLFDADNAEKAHACGVPTLSLEDYPRWLEHAPAPPPPPRLSSEDIQMILFTGGTTGLPKGAMQSYRQGIANAAATTLSWGLRDDDCVIQATPCFHAAVNAFTTPLLHLGGRVVLPRNFEPAAYLRLVRETGTTILFLVPTMYRLLTEAPEFAAAELSGVRWAISGGAPCPEPLRRAFAARGVRFKQGYGLTEAGVNCFAMTLEDAEIRPTSVGKAVLYSEAVIRRPDGTPADTGEIGELTLRGPHLFSGYFERPAASAEVLRDGWLWTGDLARRDREGFFYIVGRRKEMFVSGGENVLPVEIESLLYQHPDIAECAVLGVPDRQWGEVGLAVMVRRPGADIGAAGIRAYLRGKLAGFKIPKHLRFTEALPKSGAGKILKSSLREAFEREGHAQDPS